MKFALLFLIFASVFFYFSNYMGPGAMTDIYQLKEHGQVYLYAFDSSRCSCNPSSSYDKWMGDYKLVANVVWVDFPTQYYYNNRRFTFDDPRARCAEGHGFGVFQKDEGIPPQIRCDGSKDCNYGFTNEKFYLASDDKCYPQLASPPISTMPLELSPVSSRNRFFVFFISLIENIKSFFRRF
jgi:hypothetical protein